MPPEQWLGGRQGFATDVYAFGIVLFELVFSRTPWDVTSAEALRDAHCFKKVRVSEHPLAPIISRALSKDPLDRFGSPDELLHSLQEVAREARIYLPPRPAPRDEHRDELI